MAFVEPSDGARIILEAHSGGYPVTLIGTVQPGDPISGASTGWARADASDDTLPPQSIAGQAGISGDVITAYDDCILDFGSGSTAISGAALHLSDTAGDYSASTGTKPFVIGRMRTGRVAQVWGIHS